MDHPFRGDADLAEDKEAELRRLRKAQFIAEDSHAHEIQLIRAQLTEQRSIAKHTADSAAPPFSNTDLELTFDRAHLFMGHYCRKFNFSLPTISCEICPKWEAILTVGERRIGIGLGGNRQDAERASYVDAVRYLRTCDPALWNDLSAHDDNEERLESKLELENEHLIAQLEKERLKSSVLTAQLSSAALTASHTSSAHAKAISDLRASLDAFYLRELDIAVDATEAEHKRVLAAARTDFETRLRRRVGECAEGMERLRSEVVRVKGERDRAVGEVKSLGEERDKVVEALKAAHAQAELEFVSKVTSIEERHATVLETLHHEHAAHIQTIRATYDSTTNRLQEDIARLKDASIDHSSEATDLETARVEHTEELSSIEQRHTAILDTLRREHDDLQASSKAELEKLSDEHAHLLALHETQHAEIVDQLKADHSLKETELTATLEKANAEHTQELTSIEERHAAVLHAAHHSHAETLEQRLQALQAIHDSASIEESERVVEEYTRLLELRDIEHNKVVGQLNETHAKALLRMEEEHTAALDAHAQVMAQDIQTQCDVSNRQLLEEHTRLLATREADHNKVIADMTERHDRELIEREEMLRNMHAAEMTRVLEECSLKETEMSEARAGHAVELASVATNHDLALDALRREHADAMEALHISTSAKLETLSEEHSRILCLHDSEHAQTVDHLTTVHQTEMTTIRTQAEEKSANHVLTLETLRREHQQAIDALEATWADEMDRALTNLALQVVKSASRAVQGSSNGAKFQDVIQAALASGGTGVDILENSTGEALRDVVSDALSTHEKRAHMGKESDIQVAISSQSDNSDAPTAIRVSFPYTGLISAGNATGAVSTVTATASGQGRATEGGPPSSSSRILAELSKMHPKRDAFRQVITDSSASQPAELQPTTVITHVYRPPAEEDPNSMTTTAVDREPPPEASPTATSDAHDVDTSSHDEVEDSSADPPIA